MCFLDFLVCYRKLNTCSSHVKVSLCLQTKKFINDQYLFSPEPYFLFPVLDILFVQGTEVIFKVALCLLSSHEGEIVECDNFETIVDYLKTTIPTLTHSQMEQTIAKVWEKGYGGEWRSQRVWIIIMLSLYCVVTFHFCYLKGRS